MKTAIIAGVKPVFANGRDMVIVITDSGEQVWVPKSNYSADAETITYIPRKAGDQVMATKDGKTKAGMDYKKGDMLTLTAPRNDFQAFGKQVVKKHSSIEVMDHLISKGITPAFNV